MKCASCHDHFENPEWTQERFLGFAGLFAPHDVERIRCDVQSGQYVPARFPFELPDAPAVVPTKLAGRLHLAATLVTDPANARFAKSIVNRLWKRYLGLGLFEPVDDYRPDRGASHPELLDWLARDFVAHGCDLKHTIRLILTSRTYQLPFDPKLADRFDPTAPAEPRAFRSPALRRLTAEQVLDSMRMATAGELAPGERAFLDSRITALARALGKPASRGEISTGRGDDVAIVQALELVNGREIHEAIDTSPLLAKPLRNQDLKKLTDRVYRSVLSRPASSEEKRLGQALLAGSAELSEGAQGHVLGAVGQPGVSVHQVTRQADAELAGRGFAADESRKTNSMAGSIHRREFVRQGLAAGAALSWRGRRACVARAAALAVEQAKKLRQRPMP